MYKKSKTTGGPENLGNLRGGGELKASNNGYEIFRIALCLGLKSHIVHLSEDRHSLLRSSNHVEVLKIQVAKFGALKVRSMKVLRMATVFSPSLSDLPPRQLRAESESFQNVY